MRIVEKDLDVDLVTRIVEKTVDADFARDTCAFHSTRWVQRPIFMANVHVIDTLLMHKVFVTNRTFSSNEEGPFCIEYRGKCSLVLSVWYHYSI